MRAAGLDHVGEGVAAVAERHGQFVEPREQFIQQQQRGDADRGRKDIVRRLRHVHVIVRMHRLVRAALRISEVGDDLVHVHVERRSRAGLENVDDELRAVFVSVVEQLIASADDRIGQPRIERTKLAIRKRSRLLQQDERTDEHRMLAQSADRIVLDRALRLRAIQRVLRDSDFA